MNVARNRQEGNALSFLRPGQKALQNMAVGLTGEGQPLLSFMPSDEMVPPLGHVERMEWVRKSYERFLEKVLEKEALVGAPPTDIS